MPEEVGRQAAKALFEEISRGGVADSAHQVYLCSDIQHQFLHESRKFVCTWFDLSIVAAIMTVNW